MPVAAERDPDPDLLTLVDCQRVSGYARERLRVAVASGRLPATRVGVAYAIKRSDLEAFIRSQQRKAQRAAS